MTEEVDTLITASTRRLVESWPAGYSESLLRNHQWELLTAAIEDALAAGDETAFRAALLLREAVSLVGFARYRLCIMELLATAPDDEPHFDEAAAGLADALHGATARALVARRIVGGA